MEKAEALMDFFALFFTRKGSNCNYQVSDSK